MDLAYIDQLSNNGDGRLHRASAISKILLSLSVIISIVISNSLSVMLIIFSLLLLINYFNKMPMLKVIHFALYPAIFSMMFALIRFTYSPEQALVIVFKAVDSALAMILLITTTPYVQVFSFFRLFLPGVLVDGMFFTYRIFFILIEKLTNALTVIKLRGGLKPANIFFNIRNLASVIGILFINAFAMSERMYSIYSLRGYENNLFHETEWYKFRKTDHIPVSLSILILTVAVIF